MKTIATFENSVNVLVKAYLSGYLEAMSCCACAVGNLIANSMGYTYSNNHCTIFGPKWNEAPSQWEEVIEGFTLKEINRKNYHGLAKEQIDSTGYSVEQLCLIERDFMKNAKTYTRPNGDNFKGLMAVVDRLAIIHNIDLTAKEEAKKLFVKVETL